MKCRPLQAALDRKRAFGYHNELPSKRTGKPIQMQNEMRSGDRERLQCAIDEPPKRQREVHKATAKRQLRANPAPKYGINRHP